MRAGPTCPVTPVTKTRTTISHIRADLSEKRSRGIACRHPGRFDTPRNPDRRVIPPHHDLVGRAVKVVAFVKEISGFRQHHEAMGEAAWHPELAAALVVQFDGNVLPESWAAAADVHRNVAHAAAQNADQFAQDLRILQMQPAQHAISRARKIVLHERTNDPVHCVAICLEGFEEKSTLIAVHLRLDDQDVGNCGHENIHTVACLTGKVTVTADLYNTRRLL
jgi:hypothetical protein